ncbi:hypothetical protein [Bradymonas sediminis]|uniref:Uncharacterized protein n=1 Tax=Bradymonas sediminis TaxID=1548548 RepID=A0A2Z4FK56_9DELT|nr:hypothetical protein [Bradymonas sediminis]AWV89260.1 hypothetical protein DN745_07865 [Bradymonas sediminis]TDP73431.1 hypothetical protein DFR33_10671 [Bradymonas sediminis]
MSPSKDLKIHDPELTLTFLDFAQPITKRAHSETSADEFENALSFALTIWNVLAIDAESPEGGVLAELREQLGANRADPETLEMIDILVDRYRTRHAGDARTVGNLQVSKPERNAFEVTVGRV